jgi:hypothetical protein
VDFSRLERTDAVGAFSSLLLILSLFLPWFSLGQVAEREAGGYWVCGTGDTSCTGLETFPILRWLLIAAAAAPLILAYLIVTGERTAYPTGEFTMTVGIAVVVLVGFNGIIDKPGGGLEEIGISLDWGYFVALLAGLLMAAAGAVRSLGFGGGAPRKPPATF